MIIAGLAIDSSYLGFFEVPIKLIVSLKLADRDARFAAHGSVVVDEALGGFGVEVAVHLER